MGFTIKDDAPKYKSVSRTIRLDAEQFDKLIELSEKTGISFNKIVKQCIAYALSELEEK